MEVSPAKLRAHFQHESRRLFAVKDTYYQVRQKEQGTVVCLFLMRVAGALRKLLWRAVWRLVCAIDVARFLVEALSPGILGRRRLLHPALGLALAKMVTCVDGLVGCTAGERVEGRRQCQRQAQS